MLDLSIRQKENTTYVDIYDEYKLVEHYQLDSNKEKQLKEGDILIARVLDVIPGLQSAFLEIGEEKRGYISQKDVLPKENNVVNIKDKNGKQKQLEQIEIRDVLKQNQNIIVQVKKKATNSKGDKVSTHISLDGKYVILMPNVNIVTISKKIEDENIRCQLINEVRKKLPENCGAIVRTNAKDNIENVLKEVEYLIKKWDQINEKAKDLINKNSKEVSIIYKAPDVIEKILIDYMPHNFRSIRVSSEELLENIKRLIEKYEEFKDVNLILTSFEDLNTLFDCQKATDVMQNKKVWLKSGGFLVIEQTEALISIDVNSGKYIGKQNLEDTVFKTNLEATHEIAKQLRLRDLGGIIIIDYIDMKNKEHKQDIIDALIQDMKQDRSKYQINGFTSLGLLEMTRKKLIN